MPNTEDTENVTSKEVTLINLSKNDTNVNLSVAKSVLNFIIDLFRPGKGSENERN